MTDVVRVLSFTTKSVPGESAYDSPSDRGIQRLPTTSPGSTSWKLSAEESSEVPTQDAADHLGWLRAVNGAYPPQRAGSTYTHSGKLSQVLVIHAALPKDSGAHSSWCTRVGIKVLK